jgi:hypothetical protein
VAAAASERTVAFFSFGFRPSCRWVPHVSGTATPRLEAARLAVPAGAGRQKLADRIR